MAKLLENTMPVSWRVRTWLVVALAATLAYGGTALAGAQRDAPADPQEPRETWEVYFGSTVGQVVAVSVVGGFLYANELSGSFIAGTCLVVPGYYGPPYPGPGHWRIFAGTQKGWSEAVIGQAGDVRPPCAYKQTAVERFIGTEEIPDEVKAMLE